MMLNRARLPYGESCHFLHTRVLHATEERDEVMLQRSLQDYLEYMTVCLENNLLEYVLIPVHVNANHFFLCVLDFKKCEFQIWDSIRQPASEYVVTLRNMRKLKNILSPSPAAAWGTSNVPHQDSCQQVGEEDCAAFVCAFALQFAFKRHASDVLAQDVQKNNAFRSQMLVEICRGEIVGLV